MAGRKLKRYGLEGVAKALIALGLLFNLSAWLAAAYYFSLSSGRTTLFIAPFIFTCISALGYLVIYYRYTLFEKYPYLMNLPSFFYQLGGRKDTSKQSIAFSMIFTVHALVFYVLGVLSLLLTFTIGYGARSNVASPFLYAYLAVVALLFAAVLLQYRRIYARLAK